MLNCFVDFSNPDKQTFSNVINNECYCLGLRITFFEFDIFIIFLMMQICLKSGPYTYNAYLISISTLGPLSEGPGAVH